MMFEYKDNGYLNNGMEKFHTFSVTPLEERYFSRPKGNGFQFSENLQLIQQILGIIPRIDDSVETLSKLANASSDSKLATEKVSCYYQPNLKINKKICQWCMKNNTCTSYENNSRLRSLNFEIISKQKPKNNDIKLIEDYFKNHKFRRLDNLVFSDRIDPFKPGLTIEGNRVIFLVKLEDINYSNSKIKNPWSHIFYSKLLKRTLTVFEALYLNSSIMILKGSFGNLNESIASSESLPTVNELKLFFNQLSDNSEFNLSKKQLKKTLIKNNLIGKSIDLLGSELILLKNLYKNTIKYIDHNLFDIQQEILVNYDSLLDLDDNITNFFHEVQMSLQKNMKSQEFPKGAKFFDVRRKGYIIANSKGITKPLPSSIQLTRVIKIDELQDSWVLIDGYDSQLSYKGKKSELKIPSEWLDITYEPNNYFRKRILNTQRSQTVILWSENSELSKNENFLYLFKPMEIFSALSVNLYSKSMNYSIVDPDDSAARDDFFKLIYDVFFAKLDHRKLDVKSGILNPNYSIYNESLEKLESFKDTFTQPILRRFMPYEFIQSLVKESLVKDNFIKNYFLYSQTNDNITYEYIVMTSPDLGYSGLSDNDMVLTFQREHRTILLDEQTGDIDDLPEKSSQWKLYSSEGWQFEVNHDKKINKIIDLLNYSHNSGGKSSFVKNQFFLPSQLVFDLLNNEQKKAFQIWTYLVDRLNQEGTRGLLIMVFSNELDQYVSLIGDCYVNWTGIIEQGNELCLLEPKENLSKGSPNFLPLKTV